MSTWRRLSQIGSLSARVGGRWVSGRVRDLLRSPEAARAARAAGQLEGAAQLVQTLGQLKGAAMKAGQALSVAAAHLDLPDEVRATLAQLHDRAEPVPFEVIQATVERELEAPLSERFASFDPEPLGTASLAQAHAARLPDGRDVVVKVLHEGVVEAVHADLLLIRGVISSGRLFGRDADEVEAIWAEVRERLLEELDYLQEAANLQAFHQAFAGVDYVVVPRLHPAWCTERVLTLDRLRGRSLEDFAQHASPEARQRAGWCLSELFFQMAFHHRLLHADPHPGNFLFADDGTVQLLDYGCVKRLSPFWMGGYARAVLGALDGDRAAVLAACRDIGAWVGETPEAADAIWAFCDTVVAPWRTGAYTIGGDHDDLLDRAAPVSRELWRYPEVRGPRDIVFLHRALGGLYTLGRSLKVRDAWGDRLRAHAAHAITVASG